MDYYNANLKNPKVIGKNLIVNGEINPEIGVPPSKIIAGDGVVIEKVSGKIIISLDSSGGTDGTN